MTYDLALYPAPGPGRGHLMRCYALAEWAVVLEAKPIVVLGLDAPSIAWPCPVLRGTPRVVARAKLSIIDVPADAEALYENTASAWWITDVPEPPERPEALGFIYPHFGAEPVLGYPTFVGPTWMPLRRRFCHPRTSVRRTAEWARYRTDEPRGYWDLTAEPLDNWYKRFEGVVCPPSVMAYEAMAAGVKVRLHYDHAFPHLTAAMWEARVVGLEADVTTHRFADVHNEIDGLGAKRLLEALL